MENLGVFGATCAFPSHILTCEEISAEDFEEPCKALGTSGVATGCLGPITSFFGVGLTYLNRLMFEKSQDILNQLVVALGFFSFFRQTCIFFCHFKPFLDCLNTYHQYFSDLGY